MYQAINKKLIPVWGIGLVLFALRLYQNTHDFDSQTGLHTLSFAGIALTALTIASAALAFLLSLPESREKPHFATHFAAPEKSTAALVLGSFLLAAGSFSLVANLFTSGALLVGSTSAVDIARLATAALGIASCIGFLVLTRQMRRNEVNSLAALLPPMFFAAFWVLSLYLPEANDPVLARYAFPILAAALAAYAFAQLAGFFRTETRPRTFSFITRWAVTLCIAAVAELNGDSLLFAGCALVLSVFLSLQKEEA